MRVDFYQLSRGPVESELPPLARKVLPLLAACSDVRLAGEAIAIDVKPVGYHARVVDEEDGFRVSLMADPAITENLGDKVIVRCGATLRVWDSALGKEFEALKKPGMLVPRERALGTFRRQVAAQSF